MQDPGFDFLVAKDGFRGYCSMELVQSTDSYGMDHWLRVKL